MHANLLYILYKDIKGKLLKIFLIFFDKENIIQCVLFIVRSVIFLKATKNMLKDN